MKVIYRIRDPNGKIFAGNALTDAIDGFGSANGAVIAADFPREEAGDLTLRREILWASSTASGSGVDRTEIDFIRAPRANDPAVGYNPWPRLAPPVSETLGFQATETSGTGDR